jgi:hypothetical protein
MRNRTTSSGSMVCLGFCAIAWLYVSSISTPKAAAAADTCTKAGSTPNRQNDRNSLMWKEFQQKCAPDGESENCNLLHI